MTRYVTKRQVERAAHMFQLCASNNDVDVAAVVSLSEDFGYAVFAGVVPYGVDWQDEYAEAESRLRTGWLPKGWVMK